MFKWLKNVVVAVGLSLPRFRGAEEDNQVFFPTEPAREYVMNQHLVSGGTLEAIDKTYGKTVHGGPGSQKIGDTFDALPAEKRAEMIAARKGKIRQLKPGECGPSD